MHYELTTAINNWVLNLVGSSKKPYEMAHTILPAHFRKMEAFVQGLPTWNSFSHTLGCTCVSAGWIPKVMPNCEVRGAARQEPGRQLHGPGRGAVRLLKPALDLVTTAVLQ